MGPASRNATGARALLILVPTFLGWLYLLVDLFTMEAPNAVAQTGPGMQIIAALHSAFSGNSLPFQFNVSLCTASSTQWAALDFARAFAMWFAMFMAMMLPTICRAPLPQDNRSLALSLAGYIIASIPFCVAAVICQWFLHRTGFLDEYLVSTSWALNGAILLFVLACHLLQRSSDRSSLRSSEESETGDVSAFQRGLAYGAHMFKRCAAPMTVMFVVGLMNVLAMALITAAMICVRPAPSFRPYGSR